MGFPKCKFMNQFSFSWVEYLIIYALSMNAGGRGGEIKMHGKVISFSILQIEPRPFSTRWNNVVLHIGILFFFLQLITEECCPPTSPQCFSPSCHWTPLSYLSQQIITIRYFSVIGNLHKIFKLAWTAEFFTSLNLDLRQYAMYQIVEWLSDISSAFENEILLWGLEDKKHYNGTKKTFREKWGLNEDPF